MRRLLVLTVLVVLLTVACAAAIPGPSPKPPQKPVDAAQDEAVRLAWEQLAARLGNPNENISIVSVERVEWPDASLGLPEPGKAYAQVIVPGYRITLRAREQDYVYHAGALGGKMTVLSASPR